MRALRTAIGRRVRPVAHKREAELAYWRRRRAEQGPLEAGAPYYEFAYVSHFGLPAESFAGKAMLDVGCGPRGSLEWATQARERVGADPLAEQYVALHERPHATRYVAARAEALPLPDAHFDVVSCFNALDHVEDVGAALAELRRVTAPGGMLLLLVDVDHDPTDTEPHRLPWTLLDGLEGWTVVERRDLERPHDNLLENLVGATPFDHGRGDRRPGVLSARLERVAP